jgi:hypothetical protein
MVYLIRTRTLDAKDVIWMLCEKKRILHGDPGETRNQLIDRWRKMVGPITELVRYRGVMCWSEAIMTVASVRNPKMNSVER